MKTVLRKHAIPTDAETREIVPGVVFTLPLEPGYSTTNIVDKIIAREQARTAPALQP